MSEEEAKYLTIAQLADKLQCSVRTVQGNVSRGVWPYKKFGPRIIRFAPEHVAQILDAAEVPVSDKKEKPRKISDLVSRLQ
ncbi:hypothetical protein [Glutamicibacter sp. NPDC087344]|uniref:hypothetical protein n=1 Tax=Glutamicibacter sp. NPDC087344 TaxID=3363994 RepID=UPI0037FE8D76